VSGHAVRSRQMDAALAGFLASLPEQAAETLLAEAIRVDVPAGSLIYRPEEQPKIFVVNVGLVRTFLGSHEGRQVTVRYARPGDVAGLALVLRGPAQISIQALTRASVLAIRVPTFQRLIGTEAGVARACAQELARELYAALGDLSEQAFASIRQRLARQLLDLASPRPRGDLVVVASQQDLADAIGSVREVVTRNLGQMQEDGLVRIGRDGIFVLDPDRLADELAEPWFWDEAAGDVVEGPLVAAPADPTTEAGGGTSRIVDDTRPIAGRGASAR
jgi:CRP/FNR family cyclic AMP-dependent transcriptional regulator